jgi:hypothetical protein
MDCGIVRYMQSEAKLQGRKARDLRSKSVLRRECKIHRRGKDQKRGRV